MLYPKVMEEMTPEDKYFYLYLLTNPCTNMIGVYRIVKKQMAFDLGSCQNSVYTNLNGIYLTPILARSLSSKPIYSILIPLLFS